MSQSKKNAIVTGAYGAIGGAIVCGIAVAGYHVTLVGRDREKLGKSCQELIRRSKNPDLDIEVADLGSQGEIMDFSRRWKGSLHLLVNNAATAPVRRTETAEGIEVQWATNVLGYFWMMDYFYPFMEGAPDARIVNVASYWAGGLDPADPEFRKRRYDNDVAYRQAKQADRMLSASFAGMLKPKGITVNSCHPGDVNSKLSNFFGFTGSESPEQGAATPLFLSLSSEMRGITGKYYEHLRPVKCSFSEDQKGVEKLHELCTGYNRL